MKYLSKNRRNRLIGASCHVLISGHNFFVWNEISLHLAVVPVSVSSCRLLRYTCEGAAQLLCLDFYVAWGYRRLVSVFLDDF